MEQAQQERKRRSDAAIVVQVEARCWLARRAYQRRQNDVDWPPSFHICTLSAIKLQKTWQGHHSRHVLRILILSKLIVFKTRTLVENQCSALKIQCAWRMRTARCKKQIEERVRYTAVLTRLRAKKELLSRLAETSQTVHVSLRRDGPRSWQYLTARVAQSTKRPSPRAQTLPPLHMALSDEGDIETKKSKAAGLLSRILRGFLARYHVEKRWQWSHSFSNRKGAAALRLQNMWRGTLARRAYKAANFKMMVRKEIRTSKADGDSHCHEVFLHNKNDKNFRCVRQSDNKTIIVPRQSIVSFKTQFLHGEIEVWRIYLSESKDLVKVVILDRNKLRSQDMEEIHVNCPASYDSFCEISGWKHEIGRLSAVSINQLVRKGINHATTESRKSVGPLIGIEFLVPSIEHPPRVWDIGSTVTIRWIPWVRNAGTFVDVGTVNISLVKSNSYMRSIPEPNIPLRSVSRLTTQPDIMMQALQDKFSLQESDRQAHIATVRGRSHFRWHIEHLSTDIAPSRKYKDGVWIQGPKESAEDFEERIIRQRSLRGRGGSPLSSGELLQFLEPQHRLSMVIEALVGFDDKIISATPLNLRPFFSGWIFLIRPLICTVPSIRLETISRPRVTFPAHEDFVWHQGDIHTIRWHGISRGSFVKIKLLWQKKNKTMEHVLIHHIASFGSLPFRMLNDSPLGKSFRILIMSKSITEERAESCSFAIQTKLKDSNLRTSQRVLKRYDITEFISAPCLAVATAARAYSAHIKEDYSQRQMCAQSLPSLDRLIEKRQCCGEIDHMSQLSPETTSHLNTLQRHHHNQHETLSIFELAAQSASMERARQIENEEDKYFEAELGFTGPASYDYHLPSTIRNYKLEITNDVKTIRSGVPASEHLRDYSLTSMSQSFVLEPFASQGGIAKQFQTRTPSPCPLLPSIGKSSN